MKIIKANRVLLGVLVMVTAKGTAQTVNTGELTIKPGTIMSTTGALDNTTTGDLVNDGELYLYSHYNNDGLVTFSPGYSTGMTRMRGIAAYQDITGSVPMEWNHAEFNNSKAQPAFRLANEVSVAGKAHFEQGIIDDANYGGLMVFENGASHLNVTDDSHVQGEVRKNGNEAFIFPIGAGGQYRYAGISAPDNTTDAFTGQYFLENSNNSYPHSSKEGVIITIDDTEYWSIDKTEGNSNVFLTLSWDEDTTPSNIFAAPYEEIHIVRWDASQNLWVDEGGAANPDTKEVTMVLDPLKAYGIFTLARVKTEMILSCSGKGIVVYNAVSPNEDGINDYFNIDGIQECTNNTVEIYNRWGVKVYETKAYNTSGNVFKGISEGRATVNKGEQLPEGTYFYIINLVNDAGKNVNKAGYLYIKE